MKRDKKKGSNTVITCDSMFKRFDIRVHCVQNAASTITIEILKELALSPRHITLLIVDSIATKRSTAVYSRCYR